MKRILLFFLVVLALPVWGQNKRLQVLESVDTNVVSTRAYADAYDNTLSGIIPSDKQSILDSIARVQPYLIGGKFYVDKYYFSGGLTDTEKIQFGFDYCQNTNNCDGVYLTSPITITQNINVPRSDMSIEASKAAIITLDINDSDVYAFTVDDGGFYASENILFSNLRFTTSSLLAGIVQQEATRNMVVRDVWVNDTGGYISDAAFTQIPGKLGIMNRFENVYVNGAKLAFRFDRNNEVEFIGCRTLNGDRGYYLTGGTAKIVGGSVEGQDSTGIYYRGSTLTVQGVYFEDNMKSDVTNYHIKVDSAETVIISDNNKFLANYGRGSAWIYLDKVEKTIISKNWNAQNSPPLLQTTSNTYDVDVTQNNFASNTGLQLSKDSRLIYDKKRVTWEENSITSKKGYTRFNQGFNRNIETLRAVGVLNHETFSRDTFWTSGMVLDGWDVNWIANSDSLEKGHTPDSYFQLLSDADLTLDGETTAEVIVFDSTFSTRGISIRTTATPMLAGNTYTFSFIAKSSSLSSTPGIELYVDSKQHVSYVTDTLYQQYELRLQPSNTTSTLDINIIGGTQGDSLSIYGIQLNPGRFASNRLKTTGTAIISSDPKITIPVGKELDVKGLMHFNNIASTETVMRFSQGNNTSSIAYISGNPRITLTDSGGTADVIINSTGTSYIRNDFAIGQSSASERLDVSGNVRVRTGEIQLNSGGTAKIKWNAGNPEGSVPADSASIVLDSSTGAAYIKRSGTGNTGYDELEYIRRGSSSGTTDASGDVSVSHGFNDPPTQVVITGTDGNPRIYNVTSKGSSAFTVNVNDTTGTDLVSGSYSFDWIAIR